MQRRTQAERREATRARLIQGCIASLAAHGYARSSVAQICEAAELSQGALFRHFPTRRDLIVAAADTIAQMHLGRLEEVAVALGREKAKLAAGTLVSLVRSLCRTPTHAAWREIMIAARTDTELREAAREGLQRFEHALIEAGAHFLELEPGPAQRVSVVLLSLMHMFDSEAVTTVVYDHAALEAERIEWATRTLEAALREARH